jgi:uncharacterized membrane protein
MPNARSTAPTWTFGYAVLWGGLSVAMPFLVPEEYPSQPAMIGTSILGIATILFGLAVYRRKQWAAWSLVGFSIFDIATRIILGHSGALMPIILLLFSLNAAMSLRREAHSSAIPA